jgi:predicted acylesterase/phospholipase RssA
MSYISATILSSEQPTTKEGNMDGMTVENLPLSLAERYDNSAKIIVKNTNTGELVYDELSPYDINCLLVDTHYQKQLLTKSNSATDTVRDIILEAYTDSEDQDTLRAIAEALDIQLTKTIEWSATMYVSGSMDIDLFEDFDLESELSDNLQVSAWNGDIEVEEYHVEDSRES